MKFKFQHIFLLLSVALVASHEALPLQEDYWRSVLPNSPMPKAVKDLFHPGKSVYVGVTPDAFPIIYHHGADENQLRDNQNVTLFFLEKDLYKGNNMKLHFFMSAYDQGSLLPRRVADSIPFSSEKFLEILNRFSVNPSSKKAKIMKKTLQECEEAGIKGEEKYCATSLESMVDFSTSKLGSKIEAVSFETENETPLQKYKIVKVKKMSGEKVVACHKQKYAYVVFYCHKTESTVAYKVAMLGENGAKVEAVAVCHKDTTAWNPKHLAFQLLKLKPGNIPVCHFLPKDNLVWVPKY
ncbi:Hypothetical predicted protein [Olea europaea subsp. europaea]|uniref:BURP domain-containing protein n=1 Tax=Olea europaea subsp. europaea TaxID=158383 RepID=A0A8S0TN48_OLEEU|nr:Hypothetical predicted protein [Olea europaea subsp. europaea]